MFMEEGIIILRSVYGKVGQKYFITPCKNPQTGRYPDCVRSVNSNGDMILSEKDKEHGTIVYPTNKVFEIEDGTRFDLSDPWEKAQWECIQYCPLIAKSRDARDAKGNLIIDGARGEGLGQYAARYGAAELYVENPEADTHNKISKQRLIYDAQTYIFNDEKGAQGRLLRAKLLGRDMKSAPDNEVLEYLLEVAKKEPKRIINIYTGSDTTLRLLFIEAKEKHVIVIKNKVYMYGDIALGTTDDAVINFFSKPENKKLLELITRDTYPEMEPKNKKQSKEN